MKIQKTNALNVECTNEVYLNTYVSSWSGNVELKFNGYESDGSEYKLNVQLPLDKARALAKELTTDLENYDKEQAAKARRELEEATAHPCGEEGSNSSSWVQPGMMKSHDIMMMLDAVEMVMMV